MTDERREPDPSPIDRLASEFIDGELDDGAHADALSDPETSEVIEAAIRDVSVVREALADVEPAPISMRERHLAAALDAWDRLPEAERTGERRDATPADVDAAAAAGAAAVTAPPRPLRRKTRRTTGWLTAAAAGLVLVLAGGLVLRAVTDGSDDQSDDASVELLSDDAAGESESRTATGGAATEEALTDATIAASDVAAPATADQALTDEADEALGSGSIIEVQPEDLGPPPDTDLETLATADDVAAFAAAAIDAPVAPPVESDTASDDAGEDEAAAETLEGEDIFEEAAEPLCGPVDVVVGRAIYTGQIVIVGIDNSAEVAFAHIPATCREVVRVALP